MILRLWLVPIILSLSILPLSWVEARLLGLILRITHELLLHLLLIPSYVHLSRVRRVLLHSTRVSRLLVISVTPIGWPLRRGSPNILGACV